MIHSQTSRRAAIVLTGVVAMGAFACARDTTPTAPPAPSMNRGIVRQPAEVSPALAARISRVKNEVAWVGRIHNAAMRDLVDHREQWLGTTGDANTRICVAIIRLTLKYAPQVEATTGATRSASERVSIAQAAASQRKECRNVSAMSVFDASSTPNRESAANTSGDSLVTGAFAPYLDSMSTAVQNTDGSVHAVASAANSVLATAGSLPDADFAMLVSAATLDSSSAQQWNDEAAAGGFPSGGGGAPKDTIQPYSIFSREYAMFGTDWHRVKVVVGSDAIGCATGAMSAWAFVGFGPIGWGALAAQCAIIGIGGSAGAYLGSSPT